jgi:hypothetical protein
MLVYASYKDLKTREIHDIVWLIPGTIGLLLNIYELFLGTISLQEVIFSVGFMLILSGLLWFLKLFGEADLLAFLTLSIIHPKTPSYDYIGYTPILFSFTLIANSAFAGIMSAFYTLIVNLYDYSRDNSLFERYETSFLTKTAVMFTGRYISIENLRGPPFQYPLEINGKLIIKPDLYDDEAAIKTFADLRKKGLNKIWVSSTLPYIVVLLLGYFISIIYGDIMFSIMSSFFLR